MPRGGAADGFFEGDMLFEIEELLGALGGRDVLGWRRAGDGEFGHADCQGWIESGGDGMGEIADADGFFGTAH